MERFQLDYQRPIQRRELLPRYKSDVATAFVTIGIIVIANSWLVWIADKSRGFWLWVIIFIPLANALLIGVLLACSPIVRFISGISASLHVRVTLVGCAAAVFVDAGIILAQLHGC